MFLISWMASAMAQQTIAVPQDYRTIDEAVLASRAGDTVFVAAGTYVEAVTILDDLTIIGDGPGLTVITPRSGGAAAIEVASGSLVVEGITVRGGEQGILFESGGDLTVRDSVFRDLIGDKGSGVLVADARAVTIERTVFSTNESTTGAAHVHVSRANSVDVTDVWFLDGRGDVGSALYANDVPVVIEGGVVEGQTSTDAAIRIDDQVGVPFRIQGTRFGRNDGPKGDLAVTSLVEVLLENTLHRGSESASTLQSDNIVMTRVHAEGWGGVMGAGPMTVTGSAFRNPVAGKSVLVPDADLVYRNNLLCGSSGLTLPGGKLDVSRNLFMGNPLSVDATGIGDLSFDGNITWDGAVGLQLTGTPTITNAANMWWSLTDPVVEDVVGHYLIGKDVVGVDPGYGTGLDCSTFNPIPLPKSTIDPLTQGITAGVEGKESIKGDGDGDGACEGWLCGEGLVGFDCDDEDPSVHPKAVERPGDGLDSDCDGRELCYLDSDGDGYGDGSTTVFGDLWCSGDGLSRFATDCDDGDPTKGPGSVELIGDGIDSDCDGDEICYVDADDDGYRATGTVVSLDADCADAGEALATAPIDCNDTLADGQVVTAFYCDRDSDAFPTDVATQACGPTAAGLACGGLYETSPGGDCNDADPTVRPSAIEVIGDDADQNCDGLELCFADSDTDGARGSSTVASSDLDCSDSGEAYPGAALDCNDADPAVFPGAPEVVADGVDQDCDGGEICYLDGDADGARRTSTVVSGDPDCDDPGEALSAAAIDCDDSNNAAYPGAPELTGDEVDQDCNGAEICYADVDDDGYRDASATVASADADCADFGEAAAAAAIDCNESDPAVNPAATEVCNGIDDNCDNDTDEGLDVDWYLDSDTDGYGDPLTTQAACAQPANHVADNTDCDDTDPLVRPGATEAPADGTDSNCDGLEVCYVDGDNDTYGDVATVLSASLTCTAVGVSSTDDDCLDSDANTFPGATEQCDGVDNDCNGPIDDGVTFSDWWPDTDNDGFGDSDSPAVNDCDAPPDHVGNDLDCDDGNAAYQFDQPWFPDCDDDGVARIDTVVACSPAEADLLLPLCADNLPPDGGWSTVPAVPDCDDEDGGTQADADWWADCDGDGVFGAASVSSCGMAAALADHTATCGATPGAVTTVEPAVVDCDDSLSDGQALATYFCDADGDGEAGAVPVEACGPTAASLACGGSAAPAAGADCDDGDSAVFPGAPEVVGDAIDQDCDGGDDCYVDADLDGARSTSVGSSVDLDCADPGEAYAAAPLDCDDSDGSAQVDRNWSPDCDADGAYGSSILACGTAEADVVTPCGDGAPPDGGWTLLPGTPDCNDDDPTAQAETPYWADCDGDGLGGDTMANACGVGAAVLAFDSTCGGPPAEVFASPPIPADCDDTLADGSVISDFFCDGDGDGEPTASPTPACGPTDALALCGSEVSEVQGNDCDDSNGNTYPGAGEVVADGIDQDCDGGDTCYVDADFDGARTSAQTGSADLDCSDPGEAAGGAAIDCDDTDAAIPGPEIPNDGIDQDCDGVDWTPGDTADTGGPAVDTADTGATGDTGDTGCALRYPDADGDGYGAVGGLTYVCGAGPYVDVGGDCNDLAPSVNPGAGELPLDGIDGDCDGSEACYADADGDGLTPYTLVASADLVCGNDPGEAPFLTGLDCDDTVPGAGPVVDWYADCDGDGEAATFLSWQTCGDEPDVGALVCRGAPPAAWTSTTGLDQCDEDPLQLEATYRWRTECDQDGDGWLLDMVWTTCGGAPKPSDSPCGDPWTPADGDERLDCDDSDPAIYPGATEINGDDIDQNCNVAPDFCTLDDACGGDPEGVWTLDGICPERFAACPDVPDYLTRTPVGSVSFDASGAFVSDFTFEILVPAGCIAGLTCDEYEPLGFGDCTPSGPGCRCLYDEVQGHMDWSIDPLDPSQIVLEDALGVDVLTFCVQGDTLSVVSSLDPDFVYSASRGCPQAWEDADGDGFGGGPGQSFCNGIPGGYAPTDGDCDDGEPLVNPAAAEACDGVDTDCSGAPFAAELDADGDRFLACTADGPFLGAVPPIGYGDCDDADPAVNPGVFEELVDDGVDQNCDGFEACLSDLDGDGYGAALYEVAGLVCPPLLGRDDCDDADPSVYPGAVEVPADGIDQDCDREDACFVDTDLDGFGSQAVAACGLGTAKNDDDCDDARSDVYPGATESCDNVDNDCDGRVDDGLAQVAWWVDGDGDGFGDDGLGEVEGCDPPAGSVGQGGDCDDADSTVFPGASDTCAADKNCDGLPLACGNNTDDDGDGYCDAEVCDDGSLPGDCDDLDFWRHPGADEQCDRIDDDCDGLIDEGLTIDADGDGVPALGSCFADFYDCNDSDPLVSPFTYEQCNGIDDDCDGFIDDGLFVDADGDGWAAPGSCLPTGVPTDCNDDDPNIHPLMPETPADAQDLNCDGIVGYPTPPGVDTDGDGYCASGGYDVDGDGNCDGPADDTTAEADCDDLERAANPGAEEIIGDGIDNDCDGDIDEADGVVLDQDGDGVPWPEDCDDARATVYPPYDGAGAAPEICDGLDNDCDGQIPVDEIDWDRDGFKICQGDCNDQEGSIFPMAVEDCTNGLDDNCDGITDLDSFVDQDGDGRNVCDDGDCWDNPDRHPDGTYDPTFAATVYPGADDVCDGYDNDCDSLVDEGFDLDGDGFLDCAACQLLHPDCDCNDQEAAQNPSAREVCGDGLDNDCSGNGTDDGGDGDGDGWDVCEGDCDDRNPDTHPGSAEVCDNADNNCNGLTDENQDLDRDGYKSCEGDCEDAFPDVNPAASEVCGNGLDDDCDLDIDVADDECPQEDTGDTGLPLPTGDTGELPATETGTAPEPEPTADTGEPVVNAGGPPTEEGCGCTGTGTGTGAVGGWGVALMVALWARRSRRKVV